MTICIYKQHKQIQTAEKIISNYETVSDHRTLPPDTVYKVIEVPKKFETPMIPSTVTLNPKKKSSQTSGGPGIDPMTDSLSAVELNRDHFKFTFQDSLGQVSQLDYEIRPDKYKYIWVDGQLTASKLPWHKRLSLKPYVKANYRFLNNLVDVGAGVTLKYQHLGVSLGVSGFYYPNLQTNPGWDIDLGFKYEF